MMNIPNLDELISMALLEDVGDGDHSTLACIPPTATAKAKMMAKEDGILCGMEVGERVFEFVNNDFYHSQLAMKVTPLKHDGEPVKKGDILLNVNGMEVNSYASMMEEVALFNPGDQVEVTFLRDGKEYNVKLTLLNSKGNTQIIKNL